jgi:hypothetical protein
VRQLPLPYPETFEGSLVKQTKRWAGRAICAGFTRASAPSSSICLGVDHGPERERTVRAAILDALEPRLGD